MSNRTVPLRRRPPAPPPPDEGETYACPLTPLGEAVLENDRLRQEVELTAQCNVNQAHTIGCLQADNARLNHLLGDAAETIADLRRYNDNQMAFIERLQCLRDFIAERRRTFGTTLYRPALQQDIETALDATYETPQS